jgi:hypothetical protein
MARAEPVARDPQRPSTGGSTPACRASAASHHGDLRAFRVKGWTARLVCAAAVAMALAAAVVVIARIVFGSGATSMLRPGSSRQDSAHCRTEGRGAY